MIYTKPINDISWNDVDVFCQQQIGEGAYLDYKEDFPTQLEKTISAMANTFGGIILIGVEENNYKRPKLPLKGIPFQRGLSERVTSIILVNITPPVFPEIQVCKNETDDMAVIVIRIPQSPQTPHAISNNTKVYLRTGDINKPEELATIDEINWLTDHRIKSVTLRERLYRQAENRYNAFYNRVQNMLTSQGINIQEIGTGLFTISACPTYPHANYRNPSLLSKIYEKIRVRDYFETSNYFPPDDRLSSYGMGTMVYDGVVFVSFTGQGERIFHTEVNSQGLYFYRQPIRREPISQYNIPRDLLSGGEVLTRIDEFLDSANKYYQEIGYWGYLDLIISLTIIQEQGLSLDWLKLTNYEIPAGLSPDNEVTYTCTILAGNLEAEKEHLLFESVQKLFWAFNIDFAPKFLEAFFTKLKR